MSEVSIQPGIGYRNPESLPEAAEAMKPALVAFLLALILSGCSTLGFPTPEPPMGPSIGHQVCVEGIPHDQAVELLRAAWPDLYGVHLVALCPGKWTVEVRQRGWVGSLLGTLFGEVLGAADPVNGVAWVKVGVPSMLSLVWPPHLVLRHELHHLAGCNHSLVMSGCYESIRAWKAEHRQERFWP